MMHAYAAEVDAQGRVRLLEAAHLSGPCRAVDAAEEQLLLQLSESVLARDWGRPEEEKAWAHLQYNRTSRPAPFSFFRPEPQHIPTGGASGRCRAWRLDFVLNHQ